MSEKIYVLHDKNKNSFPVGLFTDESQLIKKYDNFDKRIKKFSKDDLLVSIIDSFNTFNIEGLQKVVGSYDDYVNEIRSDLVDKVYYQFQNNNLILILDYDEITHKPIIMGAYQDKNKLIEHYKIMEKESKINLESLLYFEFETPLNQYSAKSFIHLTISGGMLSGLVEIN
ncbi:hypothetical protein [Staphylococcus shinii]|uniref:hypothetical protein n=1 Tax=Staphylococcus shinii TaxID=2912228 RepID=UPI003F57D57D